MSPAEAKKLVDEGKAILVDVREAEELLESGIAEGAIFMPTSAMADDAPEWQKFKAELPKHKMIILYCRSGNRSGRVAEFLAHDGFDTVNLGGFHEWKSAGMPVTKFKNHSQ